MDQKLHPTEGMATTSSDSSRGQQQQQQQSEVVEGQNTTSMSPPFPNLPEQQQHVVGDTPSSAFIHPLEDEDPHPILGDRPLEQAADSSAINLVRFDTRLLGQKS
jgi:hypothetical protein